LFIIKNTKLNSI